MREDMYERIASFVSKVWHQEKSSLSENTRLQHDLGLDGTDAEEFMEAFSKEFNVDMSEFEFDSHFGPEAPPKLTTLVRYLYCRLVGGDPSRLVDTELIPITLRDLVSAAKAKKWHKLNGKAV